MMYDALRTPIALLFCLLFDSTLRALTSGRDEHKQVSETGKIRIYTQTGNLRSLSKSLLEVFHEVI